MISFLNGTDFFTELSLALSECKIEIIPLCNNRLTKYIAAGALTLTSAALFYQAIHEGKKHIVQLTKVNPPSSCRPIILKGATAIIIGVCASRILVDLERKDPGSAKRILLKMASFM